MSKSQSSENKHSPDEHPNLDESEQSSALIKRSFLLRLVKYVFASCLTIILVSIALVAIGIILFFGSQTSREWLVQDLTPGLLTSASIQLTINGLSSPEPGFWFMDEISLHIDNESLFNANHFLLNFDAYSLFDRHVDIIEISAEHIYVNIPESSKTKIMESDTQNQYNWRKFLVPARLQKLAIKRFEINNASANMPNFMLDGQASLFWQEPFFSSELSILSLGPEATKVKFEASINENLSGKVNASIQEPPKAWIGKLLHLPETQNVDINLELKARSNAGKVEWSLESFKVPWQKHKLSASAKGVWESHIDKLNITQFSLYIDQKQQNLDGWWQGQQFEFNTQLNDLPIDLTSAFQEFIQGGNISGLASIKGNISNPEIHSDLKLRTHYKQQALNADLKGSGNLTNFHLDQAHVKLADAELETSGHLFIDQQELDLNIHKLKGPVRIIEIFEVAFPDYLNINIKEAQGSLTGPFTSPVYAGFTKASGRYEDQGREQGFELESKFNGDIDKVRLSNTIVEMSKGRVKLDGLLDWNKEKFELKLDTQDLPLDLLTRFKIEIPEDLSAKINTKGHLTGYFTEPYFEGSLSANGLYKEQILSLKTDLNAGLERLNFSNLFVNYAKAHLEARGKLHITEQTLDIDVKKLFAPSHIAPLFDLKLPSDLAADVYLSDASVKGEFTNPVYAGLAKISGQFRDQDLEIQSKVKGDIHKIELSNLDSHYAGGTLKTSGLIDWQNEHLDLMINAENIPASLAAIAKVKLPEEFAARVNTKGTLKGSFALPYFNGKASASGTYQQAKFNINTTLNSKSDQIEISQLAATLTFDEQTTISTVQSDGIYILATNTLNAKLKVKDLPYQTLHLTGMELPESLKGILNADLAISGELPLPMIYGNIQSEGYFQGEAFNFNIDGSQKDQRLFFNDTRLKWNNTLLTANGIASKDQLDLHVDLHELKLTDFNKFGYDLKPGNLSLNFDLTGSLGSPILNGLIQLSVSNQLQLEEINTKSEVIVVSTRFTTEKDTLLITSAVKQGQDAKGNLSISSTFKPFLDYLLTEKGAKNIDELPLNILVKGDVGLNWINNFIDRDIQSISGKLKLDTQLNGTLKEPRLEGYLDLSKGTYVNALSQTSIENAEVRLVFDEKSITIIKAEASDGHKGTLYLQGNAAMADKDNGHIDVKLSLNKASLLRREDIEGDASGTIQLSGDFKKILVEGEVDVFPFQIMLDLIPADSIPEIEVSLEEDSAKQRKNAINVPPVFLDIKVNVDQQAYIRGRGLDAELKGKLALTGSSKQPRYNGRFQVVRGSFELFAKNFKLEEGDVLFSNDAISLFAQGRHRGKELTFIASLSGTMDDLKISLRTEPSLPEDEALARLLFGKSVRNITPIQAIQLASAIQTLRGEGGGFDPLGKARELLNVDTISLESQETSEGSGIAVGVGKYITEGVYVELSRTPEPSQPWKGSVEIELTPNINLETTTGGSSGFGGVELQWKNDY